MAAIEYTLFSVCLCVSMYASVSLSLCALILKVEHHILRTACENFTKLTTRRQPTNLRLQQQLETKMNRLFPLPV